MASGFILYMYVWMTVFEKIIMDQKCPYEQPLI